MYGLRWLDNLFAGLQATALVVLFKFNIFWALSIDTVHNYG